MGTSSCRATKFLAHLALLLGIMLLTLMLLSAALQEPKQESSRALSVEEKTSFFQTRNKHFHKGSGSVIAIRWDGTEFFKRDGKVCEFK